jgi:hypothetical protein
MILRISSANAVFFCANALWDKGWVASATAIDGKLKKRYPDEHSRRTHVEHVDLIDSQW